MDVFGDPAELLFVFDHDGFVGSLEKGADAVIFFVEMQRIASG